MAIIKEVRGYTPDLHSSCWLAETSVIVGEVKAGENCTFWFNAVVRGDVNAIEIGKNSNVQDNVTIHGTYEKASTRIGDNVSIGHNAVIHGCTLENNVLIGMGAIVMDNAVIGEGSIIAAGAIVLANTIVEPGTIYGGTPAKKLKDTDPSNIQMIERISKNYPEYANWFKK